MTTPQTTQYQKRSIDFANYAGTAFAGGGSGVNQYLTAGNVITQAQLDAMTVPVFKLPKGASPADTTRGGSALFVGTAADGTAHDWRCWVALAIEGRDVDDVTYLLKCYCYGTFTMGSKVGLSSDSAVKTTDRFADEITVSTATVSTSPVGSGDTMATAFGGVAPVADSPGGNTVAVLYLPDLANVAAVIFDLDNGSGASNVLFKRDT